MDLSTRPVQHVQEPPSFSFIPFSIALNQTTGFLLPRIVLTTSTIVQIMCVPVLGYRGWAEPVTLLRHEGSSITVRVKLYLGE